MNESHNASEPSSSGTRPKDESPKPAIDKPTGTPLSTSLDQWFKRAVDATNEMATDEKARREVAKRLT